MSHGIVVHGHVYQPPRADPRTGIVPIEPTAAPFHDWNERITDECYRPNAFARIVDGDGRIVRIVNNYERMSFNVGPTLARWLDRHAPDVMARMIAGDAAGGTAIAQPFHHTILPLAAAEDVQTELAWGRADFEARFGRRPSGVWLPETAVSPPVLAAVAAAGFEFTILAPHQVERHPGAGNFGRDPQSGLTLVVYDGAVSHDMAFGAALRDTHALVARLLGAAPDGVVVAATDAETFGHHHRFTERAIAHALFEEAPRRGVPIGPLAALIEEAERVDVGGVVTSAWSCAHGVERWRSDCGCASDGAAGWHQRWRPGLREALTLLRDHAVDAFRNLGADVFHEPMQARDAYGEVLAMPARWAEFAERHVRPLASEEVAHVLLSSQVSTLASMTSCPWFFADIARREVAIVLQEAQRSAELLASLGAEAPIVQARSVLAEAVGNVGLTGDDVWRLADAREPLPGETVGAVAWKPVVAAPLDGLLMELVADACTASQPHAESRAAMAVELLARYTPVNLDALQNALWESRAALISSDAGQSLAAALGFTRLNA